MQTTTLKVTLSESLPSAQRQALQWLEAVLARKAKAKAKGSRKH